MGPANPAGGGNLGGATFTLVVDAGNFDQELQKAGTTAAKVASDIERRLGGLKFGDAVNREFKLSGQGVLSLAYAVDDLQYGMHAVINNIPQVIAGLGLGAGVAGGLGIVAVAAQQVISHWDTLTGLFGGTQGTLPTLSKDLAELAYQLKDIDKEIEDLGTKKHAGGLNFFEQERMDKLKDLAHEGRQSIAREKAIGEYEPTQEDRDATEHFRKAAKAIGSGDLIGELLNKMSPEDARKAVGDALLGSRSAQAEVMDNLGNHPRFQAFRSSASGADAAFEKGMKEMADELERIEKNKQRTNKELTAEGTDNEQRLRAQLETERDAMQKQLKTSQEAAAAMKPSQTFGSTREYLGAVSSGGANAIRKQQLDVQKGIKAGIDKLSDKITALGRARFG